MKKKKYVEISTRDSSKNSMQSSTQFSVYIDDQDKRRLNLYLSHIFPYFSHLYINKLIEHGDILVNGNPIQEGERLRCRDRIDIEFTTEKYYLDGENIPLEIIFNTPSSQRYERTMSLLGFDPSHLSGEAGHA